MANWYMKGQSQFTLGNFHMAFYMDMNGFPEANYDDQDIEGEGEAGDPFMAFSIDTQTWTYGSQQVEIGLLGSYRFKADSTGLYGWNGSGWTDLLAEAGAENLADLEDVVISGTPADNEVLAWDNGSSKWINQTAAEALLATAGHGHGDLHAESHTIASHNDTTGTGAELNTLTDGSETALHIHDGRYYTEGEVDGLLHSEAHVLAASGPHTGTLPWSDITTADANAVSAVEAAGLSMGALIAMGGYDITFTGGSFEYGQSTPSGTSVMGWNGHFYATKVFKAVYN